MEAAEASTATAGAGRVGASGQLTLLHARLLGGTAAVAQLWFQAAVLDKYRGSSGASVLRTDTLGRLKVAQWSLDFGIADAPDKTAGAALIHVSLGEAQARIPEMERRHWAAHAVTLPGSANYLTLQLTRSACIDDGELRPW